MKVTIFSIVCILALTGLQVQASMECTICETIATMMKFSLEQSMSKAVVKAEVQALCNLYPIQVATDTCNQILNTDYPAIASKLEQGEEPGQICSQIEFYKCY